METINLLITDEDLEIVKKLFDERDDPCFTIGKIMKVDGTENSVAEMCFEYPYVMWQLAKEVEISIMLNKVKNE